MLIICTIGVTALAGCSKEVGGESNKEGEVPTVVIYNSSGAFAISGAEARSEAAAYNLLQEVDL